MRRIIGIAASAALSLSLLGGIAAADGYRSREVVREHRVEGREQARAYRDLHHRPALRFEREGVHRRGFEWVAGSWSWYGGQWSWIPGHYVRIGWRR